MGLFSKKVSHKAGQVDKSRLPRHIAIIMDGNGRWAKKRGLPRTAGHKVGAETFRKIALQCKALGVEYLTIYAFSTENWKRPAEEVSTLMSLLKKYMQEAIDTMERDKMKLRFFGDLSALSPELQDLARRANAVADRVDGFQANLCINYGGRDEILHAAKLCAAAGEEMTEENLEKHLYSAGIPDPELIIRPGGELRLSNFLLWQASYAELWFPEVLWPDFTEEEFDRAMEEYARRDRRFGLVK